LLRDREFPGSVMQVDEASPNRPRPLDDFGLQMRLRNPRSERPRGIW
jgi:hypothetical protein